MPGLRTSYIPRAQGANERCFQSGEDKGRKTKRRKRKERIQRRKRGSPAVRINDVSRRTHDERGRRKTVRMGKEGERQSNAHVTLSHVNARLLAFSLPPSCFHIFIRPFATAYPFPSQRSLCKVLSSERCVRFRVRVRIPVCVSPGQVNDLCARRGEK